jgi:hypothetical protein
MMIGTNSSYDPARTVPLQWNEELLTYQGTDAYGMTSSICIQATHQLIFRYMKELGERLPLEERKLYKIARYFVLSEIAHTWGIPLSRQALDAWPDASHPQDEQASSPFSL